MIRRLSDARLVIFDWDGTIVDSADHIVKSLEVTSKLMGLSALSRHQYRDVIGLGMPEVVARLYPDKSIDVAVFRRHYSDAFSKHAHLGNRFFEGALELVELLSSMGVLVAVATGKSRKGLAQALQRHGLIGKFHYTRCADESKSKPDPMMLFEILDHLKVKARDAVMVGDTRYDMEMAKNAGVASIGVSFGVHSKDDLGCYSPLLVVDSFAELSKQFVG